MLNIENNYLLFLAFSLVLQNSEKLINLYYTFLSVNSLKITKKKKIQITESNNFIDHNIFSTDNLHKPIQHPVSIILVLKLVNH
jgi:hypothetical protein